MSNYRKLFALGITGVIMFVLQRFGVTPADFAVYGIDMGEIQSAIVEVLMQVGIPAVFVAAQPNEAGETIWRYWRWIVAGLAIVAVLVALVVIL